MRGVVLVVDAGPKVAVGIHLDSPDPEPIQRDPHPIAGTAIRVEDVGADGRAEAAAATHYPPSMGTLQIGVGDLHFSARWEPAAPQHHRGDPADLPIASKLIHCRWLGRVDVDPLRRLSTGHRLREPHVPPVPGMLAMYPGGISECEIFFPYGACTTSSKVGQLAAHHFASIVPDEGWGTTCAKWVGAALWEGAQPIRIAELDD